MIAQQYSFTYTYPSGKIAPGGILVLPVGQPVKLSITSKDVDHDWWVPSLAPKIDALPGPHQLRRVHARIRWATL